MIYDAISQILVVAVIVAIGATFWSMKPFWAKCLGFLAFAAAVYQAMVSPALLAVAVAMVFAVGAVKTVVARRKKRKEAVKRQEDLDALRQAGRRPRQY